MSPLKVIIAILIGIAILILVWYFLFLYPHSDVTALSIISQTPIPINSQVFFLAKGTSSDGQVIVHLSSAGDTTGINVKLQETAPHSGIFTNPSSPVLITDGASSSTSLHTNSQDAITATFSSISATAQVITPGKGVMATTSDPVAFSSDRYEIENSGGVSIVDLTKSGTGQLPVTIQSATGDSIPITLIESTSSPGTFTTSPLVLFTAGPTNTSPSTPQLNVSTAPGSNIISITYASTTKNATIILQSVPTVGSAIQFASAFDTTCSTQGGDADNDGICDAWERQKTTTPKKTGLNIDTGNGYVYKYPVSGSVCPPAIDDSAGNPAQNPSDPTTMPSCPGNDKKDLYVEVDYMSGHKPDRSALAQVVNTFASHNIRLHIQVDEDLAFHADQIPLDASVVAPTDPNAQPNVGFAQLKDAHFGTVRERATAGASLLNMENDKRQIFHYAMSIHDLQDVPGSSGYGEILGNDFIISLGDFANHVGTIDQQAGTFMHELGHNLGLRHGGFEDGPNCKTNYVSVMNYAFQFPDILQTRSLDYSESALQTLDEVNGLSESSGIGQGVPAGLQTVFGPNNGTAPFDQILAASESSPINWNRDSPDVADSNVQLPVHQLGISDCNDPTLKVLTGSNDWASINFIMRTSSNFASGRSTDPHSHAVSEVTTDIIKSMDRISGFIQPQAPSAPIYVGVISPNMTLVEKEITVTSQFIDTEHGLHVATWVWGDGTTSDGTISVESTEKQVGQVTGTHTYHDAGVYTVSVTVKSSDDSSIGNSTQFVIVLGSKTVSVKSQGEFTSPAGALADSDVSGIASFNLVAKYDSETNISDGHFEFNLNPNDSDVNKNEYVLQFKSSSLSWVVVSGNSAEVGGTGTINGTGTYGFIISAMDGKGKDSTQDQLRIKIWDSYNNVIYDTQFGDSINATPLTHLQNAKIEVGDS